MNEDLPERFKKGRSQNRRRHDCPKDVSKAREPTNPGAELVRQYYALQPVVEGWRSIPELPTAEELHLHVDDQEAMQSDNLINANLGEWESKGT